MGDKLFKSTLLGSLLKPIVERKEEGNIKNRVFYLDMIRVLSTVMIVCCHFSVCYVQFSIGGFHNFFLDFANTDTGKIGVYLFFMISGAALITGYEEKLPLVKFYKKRWLSLFPLLYLAWLLFYLITVVQNGGNFTYNGSLLRVCWTLIGMDGYLGGMVPTYALVGEWFTGAIIICYLLFPLLQRAYRNHYSYLGTSVLLYALYLTNIYLYPLPHPVNIESPFVDVFYFWIGMMLVKEQKWVKQIPATLLLLLLVPILLVPNSVHVLFNSLIASIAIFILCMKMGDAHNIKDNYIFRFLRDNSYAIYLVHHQIIYLVMRRYEEGYFPLWKSLILFAVIWAMIALISVVLRRAEKWIIGNCKLIGKNYTAT